jgi:hypothetical protein
VREQQRPGFLAGEFRRPSAQDAAGAADGPLQVKERDFSRPLLIPVKKKSSLAFRVHPGRY